MRIAWTINPRIKLSFSGHVYYLGDITCDINDIKYVSWKDCGNNEDSIK